MPGKALLLAHKPGWAFEKPEPHTTVENASDEGLAVANIFFARQRDGFVENKETALLKEEACCAPATMLKILTREIGQSSRRHENSNKKIWRGEQEQEQEKTAFGGGVAHG